MLILANSCLYIVKQIIFVCIGRYAKAIICMQLKNAFLIISESCHDTNFNLEKHQFYSNIWISWLRLCEIWNDTRPAQILLRTLEWSILIRFKQSIVFIQFGFAFEISRLWFHSLPKVPFRTKPTKIDQICWNISI